MSREFIILLIGRISQALLGLITLRLATKFLSTKSMGQYYLLLSIIGYFSMSVIGPVGQFVNRKLHSWEKEGTLLDNLSLFTFYLFFVSCLSLPILFILKNNFSFLSSMESGPVIILVFIGVFFSSYHSMLPSILNMLGHRIAFVILVNLGALASLIASVFCVYYINENHFMWLSGQLIGQVFVTLLSAFFIIKYTLKTNSFNNPFSKLDKSSLKYLLKFSGPLAVATLVMWILSDSYRFIVEKYSGAEYLGLLAVGFTVSQSISNIIESLVQQNYYPRYYESLTNDDKSSRSIAWNKLFKVSMPAYVVTTFFVCTMSPFIAKILVDEKFQSAWVYIVYGAWIQFFRMLTGLFSIVGHSQMETRSIIMPNVLGGVFLLTSIFWASLTNHKELIPLLLVVSGAIVCFLMFFKMRLKLEMKFSLKDNLEMLYFSLPFFFGILLYDKSKNYLHTFIILGAFGLYYLFVQRKIYQGHEDG